MPSARRQVCAQGYFLDGVQGPRALYVPKIAPATGTHSITQYGFKVRADAGSFFHTGSPQADRLLPYGVERLDHGIDPLIFGEKGVLAQERVMRPIVEF